jgi:hypothetical protein
MDGRQQGRWLARSRRILDGGEAEEVKGESESESEEEEEGEGERVAQEASPWSRFARMAKEETCACVCVCVCVCVCSCAWP